MTNQSLARRDRLTAQKRLKALAVLRDEEAHSDVVGGLLIEHDTKFFSDVREQLPRAAQISKRLRRERELAFYGDIDFIPTEGYSAMDSPRAYEDAAWVIVLATAVVDRLV